MWFSFVLMFEQYFARNTFFFEWAIRKVSTQVRRGRTRQKCITAEKGEGSLNRHCPPIICVIILSYLRYLYSCSSLGYFSCYTAF